MLENHDVLGSGKASPCAGSARTLSVGGSEHTLCNGISTVGSQSEKLLAVSCF